MSQQEGKRERVCVTAAGGFIGSCLVKNLLERGYIVHATLRDPENPIKTSHLLTLPGAQERLYLFKADVFQHGSFDSAIQGCDFVINLATSLDLETGSIQPTIEGTLDILRACKKEKSVRRVVHTSSISAAFPLKENGEYKELLDESCWTPLDYVARSNFGTYPISKTLVEKAALQYAAEEGIEMVTVLVGIVGGSSVTPIFPGSNSVILSPFTGNTAFYEMRVLIKSWLGSLSLVHVEDVCTAHIFLMKHPSAAGRYLCCSETVSGADIADFFRKRYPEIPLLLVDEEKAELKRVVPVSTKKLTDLGFSYRYGMEKILSEIFESAKEKKVL